MMMTTTAAVGTTSAMGGSGGGPAAAPSAAAAAMRRRTPMLTTLRREPAAAPLPLLPARRFHHLGQRLRAAAGAGGPEQHPKQQQQQPQQQQQKSQDKLPPRPRSASDGGGGVGGAEAAAVDRPDAPPLQGRSSGSSSKSRAGDDEGGTGSGTGGSGGSKNRGSGKNRGGGGGQRRRSALSPSSSSSPASSASSPPSTLFHPLRIAINVALLFMVMRLWPYGGRATNLMAPSAVGATTATTATTTAGEQQQQQDQDRGGATTTAPASGGSRRQATPPMVVVNVPFSEFTRRLKADEVAAVTVDGRGGSVSAGRDGGGGVAGVAFTLRHAALERLTRGLDASAPGSAADPHGLPPALQRQLEQQQQRQRRQQQQQQPMSSSSTAAATSASPSSPPPVRVTFRTFRPPDYPLPYDLLERNGVTFAAADDRGGGGAGALAQALSTALVYGLYAALLLSVLGRLPALRGAGGGIGGGGPGGGGGGGGGGLGGAGSAAARGAGRRHGAAAAPQSGARGGAGGFWRGANGESPLAALTAALQRRLFGQGGAGGGGGAASSAPGNSSSSSAANATATATATTATASSSAAPPAVTFADVAGVDEAKEELQEVVDFLRAPARFARLGARPPAGVLLVGPPGTGKTLLARAVAGEAGVPFFSIAASEFIELYVGLGALRVRELFASARREAPCIVFIDEIDAVAKGRGDSRRLSAGNDEREQTLNQLLTEMDGFESGLQQAAAARAAAARRRELQERRRVRREADEGESEEKRRRRQQQGGVEGGGGGGKDGEPVSSSDDDDDDDDHVDDDEEEAALMAEADAAAAAEAAAAGVVIVLAATNRPDVLDPALLRPGRFDRRVAVERPDRVGRQQILQNHMQRRALPLARDVDPARLAGATTGFTGADLANLVNEAALLAGRRGLAEVGAAEFDAALMRSVAGIEKKRSVLSGSEKRTVALHEAGHAVVGAATCALLPGVAAPVQRLSIVPRSGGALGFAYAPPKSDKDRALMYDVEVRAQLALLMGGRAAEALRSPAVSTGASDDIRRATELAVRAVSEFGLSPAVGPVHVGLLGSGGASGGSGGDDDALGWLLGGGGAGGRGSPSADSAATRAEREASRLLRGALAVAADTLRLNATLHLALADLLETRERLEGEELAGMLAAVEAPPSLRAFVLKAETPSEQQQAAAMAPMLGAGNAADDLAL